jgi:tripartite motif-containing protein 71
MEARCFDAWTRSLVGDHRSRRAALRLAAGATLASIVSPFAGRRPARAFGNCRHLGQSCSASQTCCSGGLICSSSVCAPATTYNLVTEWGSFGTGDGQFNAGDSGLAAGSNVYLADTYNNRMDKFSRDGLFLGTWGKLGRGPGEFNEPNGVALDAHGNVYVTDWFNRRVQKFDGNGKLLTAWGHRHHHSGRHHNGPQLFVGPFDVGVGGSGNVYVTDTNNGSDQDTIERIQKFTSDGVFIRRWGSPGSHNGQFYGLGAVAVDAADHVHVVDWGNSRIQVFAGDGTFVRAFGTFGTGPGQFAGLLDVALDVWGFIYALDNRDTDSSYYVRIQKFTGKGQFVTQWSVLEYASALAVDGAGNVYVVDSIADRIAKYTPETGGR